MIVVDTDVVSYFWLQMTADRPAAARAARERDADWALPHLWRSEFRSVLRGYMTRDLMTLEEAQRSHQKAQEDLHDREHEVPARSVLQLVDDTRPYSSGRRRETPPAAAPV
jgi:predicted nucleic acid-binding protein